MAAQVHAKTIMAVNYSVDINIDPEDDSNAIFILQLEKDSWVGLGYVLCKVPRRERVHFKSLSHSYLVGVGSCCSVVQVLLEEGPAPV